MSCRGVWPVIVRKRHGFRIDVYVYVYVCVLCVPCMDVVSRLSYGCAFGDRAAARFQWDPSPWCFGGVIIGNKVHRRDTGVEQAHTRVHCSMTAEKGSLFGRWLVRGLGACLWEKRTTLRFVMRMSDACNTGCVGSFGVLRVGMLCCVAPPSVLVGCVHGFCMSVTIARSCLTGVSEISSSPWARLPLRERRPDPPPCRMAQGRSVNIRNTVP